MIRDASLAFLMRIGGAALWLGYTIVLARMLSQEDFGLVLYVLNFLLIATPVAALGFETTTMRFGSQYWHTNNKPSFRALINRARKFAFAGSLICLVALLIAAAAQLDTPITGDWLIAAIAGLSTAATAIMGIHKDALRAANKLVAGLMGINITRAILPLIGSAALGFLGYLTPVSALALYLGSLGLSLVFEAWQISKLDLNNASGGRSEESRIERKQHIQMAMEIWPGEIANALLMRAAGLVVGLVLDLSAAALFLAAQRVAVLSQFLTDAVLTAAAPEIARAAGTKDRAELQRTVSKVSILMLVFDTTGKLGLAAFGWVFLWLLGDSYVAAYPTLIVFLLGYFSWALLGPSALVMNMSGLHREQSVATVVGAALVIATSWLGTFWLGALGAAIGYAISVWMLNGWLTLTLYRRLGVKCGVFGVKLNMLRETFSGELGKFISFSRLKQ